MSLPSNESESLAGKDLFNGMDLQGYRFVQIVELDLTDGNNPTKSEGGQIFYADDADAAREFANLIGVSMATRLALLDPSGKVVCLLKREGGPRLILSRADAESLARNKALSMVPASARGVLKLG